MSNLFSLLTNTASNYFFETAKNITADGTYTLSKLAFYSTVETAGYLADKAATLPDYVLNTAVEYFSETHSNPNIKIYENAFKPILTENNPLSGLNHLVTEILVPRSAELNSTFQAADLIGPCLLMGISSKKVLENALSTATKVKNLVMFKESSLALHNCSVSDGSIITVFSQENFSVPKLLTGIVLDSLCTAGWLTLNQLARQGIINALVEIGSSEPTARTFVNATALAPAAFLGMKAFADSLTHWLQPSEEVLEQSPEELLTVIVMNETIVVEDNHSDEDVGTGSLSGFTVTDWTYDDTDDVEIEMGDLPLSDLSDEYNKIKTTLNEISRESEF